MSYEVKNIEQENLDFKRLVPITLFLIIAIVGSAIFVYYWFTLEKDEIMYNQYLGKESKIKQDFDFMEKQKFNDLDIDEAKKQVEKSYLKKYGK